MRKRFGPYFFVLLLLLSSIILFPLQTKAEFKDLTDKNPTYAILALSREGIIQGYPDGTFRPAAYITREEFGAILFRMLELEEKPEAASHFIDIPKNSWARGIIGALVDAGITKGVSANRFGYGDYLTREQMASFFVRVLGYEEEAKKYNLPLKYTDSHQIRTAHRNDVAFATEIGLIAGTGNNRFSPQEFSQRQHVARLAYEVYFNKNQYSKAVQQLKNPVKIFIDPGHGGHDSGAVSPIYKHLFEKHLALEISLRVKQILEQEYSGVTVKMSRMTDTYIPLSDRAKMANEWGADHFISIHHNAGGGTGFESWIYSGKVSNVTLQKGQIIHDHIAKSLGVRDRGIKRGNFVVLRETQMPAILLELLFLDHPTDAALLNNPAYREKIARAVAEGIAKAWDLKKR
ncbi:cell wall hydrolase/autolysin [Caldalkalibacillus thermarum TA2.A1]|uniref:Cell wall hydrolase/autolysin n=1 Tax=Caldalkalibacillus thermarum (strain TA2.A1) TaxID=986075 RepID=F5L999_CALTT|nr:N-acetylmuramoyl-L-alanine amidase [Caldalkalibacillus thermarum]EGL82041.1 cell wall hydrolase/autolysin [Caldalkalibacillus thermarum TA2.A1]QZT34040.1 N-acetylmuramoyl-L-alanine amidase [Caldalkalibacillus thermarum TA2.A1]